MTPRDAPSFPPLAIELVASHRPAGGPIAEPAAWMSQGEAMRFYLATMQRIIHEMAEEEKRRIWFGDSRE